MTRDELVARLRSGRAILCFDAPNIPESLFPLCATARAVLGNNIRLIVPTPAHVEKLFDVRQALGTKYDGDVVRKALQDKLVEVLPLDDDSAEEAARQLWRWYPTRDDWNDAKRGRAGSSSSRRQSATIDWLTAAMCPENALLVSDDSGPEFTHLTRVGSKALRDALEQVRAHGDG